MPMPMDANRMARSLTGKFGFTIENRRHRVFKLHFQGLTITTLISHGAREIDDTILSRMAQQLRLTIPQVRAGVDCTFTRDDYLALLASVLPPPEP
jgi:hypothetical protein